jgi:hypothetical protein
MERNTPYKQLQGSEQIAVLDAYVRSAYFRRSRQLPDNLPQIVETLRQDILKRLGSIPVGVLDDAITTSTLGDLDKPLSVAFFFDAAKKAWDHPKTNFHQWDTADPDRTYWQETLDWLEGHGRGYTAKANEVRERLAAIDEGDTERVHIAFLDTCAEMEKTYRNVEVHPDSEFKTIGQTLAKVLPAFNPRREYHYLVRRGQLALNADDAFMQQAILDVNTERMAGRYKRLTKEEAETNCDVKAKSKRLAVIEWLKRCNEQGTTPSVILSPLVNEMEYQRIRKETV